MKPMKTSLKTAISALAITAVAGVASAADFGTLDANVDGQVDFQEYKTVAVKEGKTVTLAAQEFTSMTQGDATLTEDEFLIAEAKVWEKNNAQFDAVADPMAYETTETVDPVGTFESFPQEAVAMEPSMDVETSMESETDMTWDETPSESMTSSTEIESDSAVAGDVMTSDDWTEDAPAEDMSVMDKLQTESETALETGTDAATDMVDDIEVPEAPDMPDIDVEID